MKNEESTFTDFNFSFITFPRQVFVNTFHKKKNPLGLCKNNKTIRYAARRKEL